jgi:hypothetical protein
VRHWDVDPALYKDYDILFLHEHPFMRHSDTHHSCEAGMRPVVREGLPYWYATGAMLATGRHQQRFLSSVSNTSIHRPLDHWLNEMWETGALRVGSLCPHHFRQHTEFESTVDNGSAYH